MFPFLRWNMNQMSNDRVLWSQIKQARTNMRIHNDYLRSTSTAHTSIKTFLHKNYKTTNIKINTSKDTQLKVGRKLQQPNIISDFKTLLKINS